MVHYFSAVINTIFHFFQSKLKLFLLSISLLFLLLQDIYLFRKVFLDLFQLIHINISFIQSYLQLIALIFQIGQLVLHSIVLLNISLGFGQKLILYFHFLLER